MIKRSLITVCLLALTISAGCQKKEQEADNKETLPPSQVVLATVDGENITLKDYQQYLQHIQLAYSNLRGTPGGEKKFKKLQRYLLDQLIDKRIMLKEARRLKLEVSPVEIKQETQRIANDYTEIPFEKVLQQEGLVLSRWQHELEQELLVKKLIFNEVERPIIITDKELEKYFQKNQAKFQKPELVRVRQIVVEEEFEADKLWKKLNRGADFDKLAETYSLSPEGAKGGDLGYFSKGQMPVEFEKIAFQLKKKGEISKVFSTNYGFHIFQLVDRKPAHQATLEEVKEELRENLRQQKVETSFNSWISAIRAQVTVKINPYFIENS